MTAETVLSRLEGVRRTGEGRYRARCPVHGSKGGTLAIREEPNGNVLVYCHALCPPLEILEKIGLDWQDLFPRPLTNGGLPVKPIKRPWRAGDVVHALEFELTVVWVLLAEIAQGDAIDQAKRDRAGECRRRVLRFLQEIKHAA